MWKIYVNKNFDPDKQNGEPPFFVCNGNKCYPAYSADEAYDLCEKLNNTPDFQPEIQSVPYDTMTMEEEKNIEARRKEEEARRKEEEEEEGTHPS